MDDKIRHPVQVFDVKLAENTNSKDILLLPFSQSETDLIYATDSVLTKVRLFTGFNGT